MTSMIEIHPTVVVRPEKLDEVDALFATLTDDELAKAWARCMRVMRKRDLTRTANTPVGDYAERIACDRLSLTRLGFSEKSIDALGPDGTRYQIKGRRMTPENKSRQLGAIRDVRSVLFDVLLALFFNEDLDLVEMWSIPCEVVQEAAYVERTNSTRFVLTKAIEKDPRVTRLL